MQKTLALSLLLVCPLMAQQNFATLTGAITDPSGSAISNAELVVTSATTNLDHATLTNGAGIYTVSSLPADSYTVRVSAKGFDQVHVDPFKLDVGQTRTLDLRLSIATISSQIEVTSAAPALSQSSAEIGGVIQRSQAQELPLNGRSWVSLIALTPGAIDSGAGSQDQVRFAGLSAEDNMFRFDGIDATGVNHQYEKVNIRLQMSTEAIAEFKANSALYSADEGGSPGGQVELVSRSGTNTFAGSAWEFLRNSVFDARSFNAASVSPFRLNNYGANFGGPILRNKLFFFVNYEGLRQVLDQPLNGLVPSPSFRSAVLATSPALTPVVNAYPLGSAPTKDPNAYEWFGTGRQSNNEDSGLFRIDYQMTEKTLASLRFNTDHTTQNLPQGAGSGTYLTDTGFTNLNTPNAVIDVQHTFSPTITNDAKFGFNRAEFAQGQTTALPYAVSITGLSSLNNPSGSIRNDNSFNILDDATFVAGRHTIKAGINIRRLQENKSSPNSPNQTFTFNSEQDFLNNVLDSDSYIGTVPTTGQRMTEYFGYVMDTFQRHPNFTLNLGLRYEYFGVDHEVLGRGLVADPLSCPNVICPAGTSWYEPNTKDFSPRVSFAWSPAMFNQKLVIRSGFGIFYGRGQFGGLGQAIGNVLGSDYTLTPTQVPDLSFPVSDTSGAIQASLSPAGMDSHRKDQAIDQWSLSIQSEIAPHTNLQVAYFGNAASHLFTQTILNGVNPFTGARPYPGFSTIPYETTDGHSSFHALQFGVNRSLMTGLLLSTNYQWSHGIDNGSLGGGEADVPQNVNCLACERASSDQDMRQYFSSSAIWQIPVGHGHALLGNSSKWTNAILGNWQLSGIGTARSGLPLNVVLSRSSSALPDQINKNQRPNYVYGQPLYIDGVPNVLAYSVPANGTWGNLGRNILRAPGLWQMDLALVKRVPLREHLALSFRAELFNVFNRAQLGPYVTSLSTSHGLIVPGNFGSIQGPFNSTPIGTGTPRQMQLMMRLDF
jgi:Carboxypeptidase regulatory-like domain